ncbi:MAG: hypothetical protein ABEK36_01115 [Candidatus Aenigmatarchaeota archaeon]
MSCSFVRVIRIFQNKGFAVTVDIILVLGTLVVAAIFLNSYVGNATELVSYYSHLEPRLTTESISQLVSAASIAPNGLNITFAFPEETKNCEISLDENPNNFFTQSMEIGLEASSRVEFVKDDIRKVIGGCEEGTEENGFPDCQCVIDGECKDSSVTESLANIILGPKCPKGSVVDFSDKLNNYFRKNDKEVNLNEVKNALVNLGTGRCTFITVKEDKETGDIVMIDVEFPSRTITSPIYNGVELHEENEKIDCQKGMYFRIFKENNKIGFEDLKK